MLVSRRRVLKVLAAMLAPVGKRRLVNAARDQHRTSGDCEADDEGGKEVLDHGLLARIVSPMQIDLLPEVASVSM